MIFAHVFLSVISFVTSLFLVFLSVYIFFRRSTEKTAYPSIFFFLASAIFTAGYGFELLQTTQEGLRACIAVKSIGSTLIPYLFFWQAISLTTNDRGFARRLIPAVLAVAVAMTAVVLTNDVHHLYFTSIEPDKDLPFPMANIVYGPIFYVQTVIYFLCTIATFGFFILRLHVAKNLDRARMKVMLFASALSFVEPITFHFISVPWNIDVGPYFLTVVCFFLAYGILRYGLFDVRNLARQMVFNAMDDAVVVVAGEQEIVDWNPTVCNIFPGVGKDLSKKPLSSVSEELAALCVSMSYDSTAALSVQIAGSTRSLLVKKLRVFLHKGYDIGTALILRDITEEKRHVEMLEELATSDSLTGIYNRRKWTVLAETELMRAQNENRALSVLMIDIDFFKEVNDTWGHAVGDAALKTVTTTIAGILRITDIFGRWGGEEFAILLSDSKLADAVVTAERLRRAVSKAPILFGETKIPITVSVGIATLSASGTEPENIETLLRRADAALYRAKGRGRNRIETDGSESDFAYSFPE